MDAGEDKKVSREEFTSETVRNKLETVKLKFEKTKHKHKTTLSMTNTQIRKFTIENLHNKYDTVTKTKTHIAKIKVIVRGCS